MNEDEDYDVLMKIIVVGDSGVGKTNLVNRFTQQTFLDDCKPTVGVEFFSRNIDIEGKTIKA
jgi:small GTP-binding protein